MDFCKRLKGLFDYTDQELPQQFHFNLLTAYAVGQDDWGAVTLCERRLYYNRERLLAYAAKTGRNLLKEKFDAITDNALRELHIDPKTQRIDSSCIGSFIKQMSRLEPVVKVLQQLSSGLGLPCPKPEMILLSIVHRSPSAMSMEYYRHKCRLRPAVE